MFHRKASRAERFPQLTGSTFPFGQVPSPRVGPVELWYETGLLGHFLLQCHGTRGPDSPNQLKIWTFTASGLARCAAGSYGYAAHGSAP